MIRAASNCWPYDSLLEYLFFFFLEIDFDFSTLMRSKNCTFPFTNVAFISSVPLFLIIIPLNYGIQDVNIVSLDVFITLEI